MKFKNLIVTRHFILLLQPETLFFTLKLLSQIQFQKLQTTLQIKPPIWSFHVHKTKSEILFVTLKLVSWYYNRIPKIPSVIVNRNYCCNILLYIKQTLENSKNPISPTMAVQFQEFQVQHPVSSRRNRVTSLKPKVAELVHVPMASPGRTKTRFAWANAPCPVLHQSNYSSILFGTRGGISIGHRRSGCPSRGGVLREYHRKTLKSGPLNGEPEKERERRKKDKKKKRNGDGTRRRTDPDDCRVNANV